MTIAQIPENEKERLKALQEYVILDTLPESDFDGITQLAATICGVPVALITFIDEDRQIFKSHYGTEIQETPRHGSFCTHTLKSRELFVVEDAENDPRFHDNLLVKGEMNIVFYAGVPLINHNGYALGTLCVIDHEPRSLSASQADSLRILANQVIQLLELRKKNAQLEASKNAYSSLFEQNPDGVFSFDLNGRFLSANDVMLKMVGKTVRELRRTTFARYVSPAYMQLVTQTFSKATEGEPQNYNVEIISASGKKLIVNITNIPNVSNGNIIGVYGIAKDITEKHELQENLAMILNHTRETFMIVNKDLEIVFYNNSAWKSVSAQLDQNIYKGKSILDLADPKRIGYLKELYARVFEGEVSQTEIPLEMPGKETLWITNSFSPVISENGTIDYVIITSLDITERKKSQLKLEKSELGLKQAQELAHIGNWEFDFKQQKSFWSDEIYRILGFSPGEIEPTFENYLSFVHKDDYEKVLNLYKLDQAQPDQSQKSTHRIICQNREMKIVYSESRFIVEDDKPTGIYGILRDVTEKQKSIEQFRNSEQKTRLIMNGSLDAIIWIDAMANITFWNPQSENIFGWSKEEAVGKDLVKLIATKDTRQMYYGAIRSYIEKGEESVMNVLIEQVAVNKANEEFPIELTVLPIRQDDEISFCVFIRNISERKRFSNELRLSERRYRSLFYLSPMPMWVYDLETWEFLDVNDAAVRHYGYSYEEFMSMTLDELRPEDELGTFEKALNFVKKSVVFHRGDFQHKKKNGDIIDVDVQSNMIEYNGKDARLILAIDITRERDNERKLKSLTQSLEQKVKERTIELNEANQLLSYEHQQTRDSITYAQNIQSSILHREYDILQMFAESFVLFKPKDKVSGDFFWCYETEDYYLIAVLDCTGHGVPGAMISMVGFQLLNQIVIINGETSPAAVLDQLDKEVNKLFHQNQEESSVDGMDMIYCRISKTSNELHYAGAQRPLFFYSDGELTELKGNKLSIGGRTGYYKTKEFEEKRIVFNPGDCIYLTTDGYYSQFGGPRNKVMLKKRMKDMLSSIALLPAEKQLKELQSYFKEWQGNEEQVDDVLVIGVRLMN